MDPEGGSGPGAAREVRVEGLGLFLLAGALVILLGGVFYLGFQLGRAGSSDGSRAAAAASSEPVDTSSAAATPAPASVFDKVEPKAAAAEPARQATQPAPAPDAPAPAPVRMAPTPGDWFVQVFAGRDRRAAESVVSTLTGRGYPVQLDSSREGRDALYKVRVGGYRDEDGARAAADRLRKDGQSGAWVTRTH
jgi:cell division septation protein DedD